jgi:Reverse transcriptase (RNA-dependent DNA polymerase)/Endonuclease-reverse transcriptase
MGINACSIINKVIQFKTKVELHKPHIIVICETNLHEGVEDSALELSEYTVFRRDRKSKGGGVLVAVKSSLNATLNWVCENYEVMGVEICVEGEKLLIIGCYRPHDTSDMGVLEEILVKVNDLNKDAKVIVVGDLNLPNIHWEGGGNDCLSNKQNVVNSVINQGFSQVINEGTRDTNTGKCNLLDVVLVKPEELLYYSEVVEGISDHKITVVELKIDSNVKEDVVNSREILLYHKADKAKITKALSESYAAWESQVGGVNINVLWDSYIDICNTVVDHYVPKKIVTGNSDPPHYNSKVRSLKRRGRRIRAKIRQGKARKEDLMKLEQELNIEKQKAHDTYMRKIVSINDDTKDKSGLYKHIRRVKKGGREIPTLKKDGQMFKSDQEKAEVLQEFYKSVFQAEEEVEFEIEDQEEREGEMFEPNLFNTLKIIKGLKNNKACGEDKLRAEFLKLSPEIHANFLHKIACEVVRLGKVPEGWKKAVVVPIFKGGERGRVENYRPVSLTSLGSRIVEMMIAYEIVKDLEGKGYFDNMQHGFRSGYSCETQVLGLVEELADVLDKRGVVHAIFLDFAKAFDKVPHSLLIKKLNNVITDKRLVRVVEDFLKHRTQRVRVGDVLSEEGQVTSGVPQGSVLGPILFIIYIQDMKSGLKSKVRLFADDSVIYKEIKRVEDTEELQSDLTLIGEWVTQNKLVLNVSKCTIIKFSRKRKDDDNSSYIIMGEILKEAEDYKYLGITLDSELKWNKHVDKVVAGANKHIGFVYRNLRGTSVKTKDVAYKTLIRPKLEYCSSVWDPYTLEMVNELERVQKLAARRVTGQFRSWRVEEENPIAGAKLVNDMGWKELSVRRKTDRLCAMYSVQHGSRGWAELNSLTQKATYLGRNDHDLKLRVVGSNLDVGKYSFLNRTVRDWNGLPSDIVMVESRKLFRKEVEKLN